MSDQNDKDSFPLPKSLTSAYSYFGQCKAIRSNTKYISSSFQHFSCSYRLEPNTL